MNITSISRVAAVVTSVALAAGIATVTATGANAATKDRFATHSTTEPIMPTLVNDLCVQYPAETWVSCSTGTPISNKTARYLMEEQSRFQTSRLINDGVPVFYGKRGATQHVPVPRQFINKRVTVEATVSIRRNDLGCGWFYGAVGNAVNLGIIEPLDKGKVVAEGKARVRIKGNALTFTVPNMNARRAPWFVDLTFTRNDGKTYKVTILSDRTVRDGSDTFTFAD